MKRSKQHSFMLVSVNLCERLNDILIKAGSINVVSLLTPKLVARRSMKLVFSANLRVCIQPTPAPDKRPLIADQRDVGDQTLIPLLHSLCTFLCSPSHPPTHSRSPLKKWVIWWVKFIKGRLTSIPETSFSYVPILCVLPREYLSSTSSSHPCSPIQ